MSAKQTLRQWLANGENDRVVEALQAIAERYGDKYFQNDVTHQAGRYFRRKKDFERGLIAADQYHLELNQIFSALINLIDNIPPNATLENQPAQPDLPAPKEDKPNTSAKTDAITPATSPHLSWITGLMLLLGAAITLIGFVPCPTAAQETIFRLLMAIGAGGVATLLPGLFSIDVQGVKAGSAIGVFALVYLVNPAKAIENNSRCNPPQFTSVTVFVHGKNGKQDMILRQQGSVIMDVNGGERKRASINENGQAFFQNLRVGDTVQLNVDFSEPYKAIQPNKKYVIDDKGSIYLETALQGLDKVFGTVIWQDQPLQGVLVSIGDLRNTTDATGRYSIDIPESAQRKEQDVQFLKKGFKMLMKKAYPQTNEPLNIIMEK